MTQQTYTPADIVKFALSKDAVNIATAFDQMVGQKVVDAIQDRKIEVAKAMYGQVEQAVDDAEATLEDDAEEQDASNEVEDKDNQESEESNEDATQSA